MKALLLAVLIWIILINLALIFMRGATKDHMPTPKDKEGKDD